MVEPSFPNLINYGNYALKKKQELQHAKDFMALNLRKIKRSYLMPRKAREREGSHKFTSIKIIDQVLLQMRRNKRRIYLKSNATGAKNTVIMLVAIEVLTKGSMKLQLLMSKKTLLIRSQGRMIIHSSSSN